MGKLVPFFIFFVFLSYGFWSYHDDRVRYVVKRHPKAKGFNQVVSPLEGKTGHRISQEMGIPCIAIGGAINHDDCTIKYSELCFNLFEKKTQDEARLLLLQALEIGIDEYRKAEGLDPYIREDFGVKNLHFSIMFKKNSTESWKYPNLTMISQMGGKFFYSWWIEGSQSEEIKEIETLEEAIEKSGREWDFDFKLQKELI